MQAADTTSLEYINHRFGTLSDITDRVAMMNSHYDADLDIAFSEMESFIHEVRDFELDSFEGDALQAYLSHMSFHREIVAEIIAEARQLLIEERRAHLKRLVTYHKEFVRWFSPIEKRFAA